MTKSSKGLKLDLTQGYYNSNGQMKYYSEFDKGFLANNTSNLIRNFFIGSVSILIILVLLYLLK